MFLFSTSLFPCWPSGKQAFLHIVSRVITIKLTVRPSAAFVRCFIFSILVAGFLTELANVKGSLYCPVARQDASVTAYSEAQQYMRSYQAHQLLSLTLSNYSSISGNCTGISTANQRSLYTFETV